MSSERPGWVFLVEVLFILGWGVASCADCKKSMRCHEMGGVYVDEKCLEPILKEGWKP